MFHNLISYVHGLLDELEGAQRAGREATAGEVCAELDKVLPEVKSVDAQTLDDDGKASMASLHGRLTALSADAATPTRDQTDETPGKAGRGRTAKAAAAPETAVPAKPE